MPVIKLQKNAYNVGSKGGLYFKIRPKLPHKRVIGQIASLYFTDQNMCML